MAIKINTAYGERLTSGMLNEKISNLVGGNEKLSGFDVSIASPTSVTIKPGKAIINGCAIEETSDTNTVVIDPRILSNDSIAYVVIDYSHENKRVVFSCVTQLTSSMVKLATLFIKSGVISELTNHNPLQTLNSIVSEAAEIEAQRMRDSIPSGFVELGGLDYDFMLNNENQVKLKTKSIAYVNGYRVEIPAGTIINIGKSPEKSTREDLLFLEAWKDTDFSKNGKLKYRIRHISDVDFNFFTDDGITSNGYGWNTSSNKYQSLVTGGNSEVIKANTTDINTKYQTCFIKASSEEANVYAPHIKDLGLYIAGQGNASSKELLKTVDGYVYAIPMFRLYRKPSCGKSIPFEYDKINPKVDYDKFTKLIKEDKVERVVTENIKGRSLVNLGAVGRPYFNAENPSQFTSNEYSNDSIKRGTVVSANVNNVTGWRYLGLGFTNISCLKYDTNYTVIFKSKGINSEISVQICDSSSTNFLCGASILAKDGVNLVNFKTTSNTSMAIKNQIIYFALGENHLSTNNQPIVIGDVILIEGTLTQPVEYFERLKSLGEDDGNLITIKNGILNDDTYDINDGNQKLLAFPNITHVNSTNTIIPTIEANVIKGEESTPLEKLGSKLETEGHEIIEFTKIKGRTMQNLVNVKDKRFTIGQYINADICPTLKLDTWYTILVYVSNNTLDAPVRFSGFSFGAGEGAVFHSDSTFTGDINIIKAKETGLWRGKARLSTLGSNPTPMFTLFAENPTSGSYIASAIVLEGDHMDTPLEDLPFVEGIKSVGETEGNIITLHSTGKNIYNGISENTFTTTMDSWYFLDGKLGAYGDMSSKTDTIFTLPKGQYKFNYEGKVNVGVEIL